MSTETRTARTAIDARASAHGWRIVASEHCWDPQYYERRIGRQVANIAVVYDADGGVLSLSGARNRGGYGGFVVGRSTRGKKALVIERLDPQWWIARDKALLR